MSSKKGSKKDKDIEKTKKVKTVKNKKANKKDKSKKGKHPKLKMFIRIVIALVIIAIIIAAGICAGIFFGLFGDSFKISVGDLEISMANSVLIDINGNQVATLNGDENREVIRIAEMGEYIPKAFVAIEDKRFYEHSGVDIGRTVSATLKYFTGNSTYGGSTITQQLIKNATGENDKTSLRKVKEIAKAFQIEREMSKDQILESYLNTIPLGGGAKNVYGVQVAANYYFDKEPIDLTLAQSAYIAGINHSPNLYNPFKDEPNMEKINNRTKTVLSEMLDQEKITDEQYSSAVEEVNEGLAFSEGNITSNNSLTQNEEAAIVQIANEYAKEHNVKYDVAKQKIMSGGYKIYITEDSNIQSVLDDAYANNSSWIKTKTVTRKNDDGTTEKVTVQLQSAMVVIDHKTGYVVGAVGVLGEKTAWGTNRVNDAGHQPGSSIKPLAVISPSLQEGLITAGTVVDDTPVAYGSYTPRNSGGGYNGLMNIRNILRVSRNIPEVKMIQKLTAAKSIQYLKSYGITTMDDEKDNTLSLALGGVTHGISPLEMAGAYATIANDGVYIEPTFYLKVEDSNGKIVMEKKQETHRVISEQNAYIMQSLLTEPTGTGLTGSSGATGTGARVSGMQTCGKTGTTNDSTATWFCGFTPYYAGAMYFGYDRADDGKNSAPGSGSVASRWGGIMNKIHSGLKSASFDKPSGIVTAKICQDSGLLATTECEQEFERGNRTYTEMFAAGTVPTESCTTHVKLKICKDTGKIANEYCTNIGENVFITRVNRDSDTSWQSAGDAEYMAPTETCTTHTKPADVTKPVLTLQTGIKDIIELKVGDKFIMPTVTAKDDIDGDVTKNIKTEIKKDGRVVERIDTSTVGTYTITYTVQDAAGNIATKAIAVKVLALSQGTDTTNTATNNINTTTSTNAINNVNNISTNTKQ